MLALPWTADVSAFLFPLFGADVRGRAAVIARGITAAAWIWALNASIQPIQAGIRALVVDSCPPKQQVQASAYASCATGVGSVVGYASGFVPLPQVLPWLGDTQFKGLCVIASVALGSSVAITCLAVVENTVEPKAEVIREEHGVVAAFNQIFTKLRTLPRPIQRVCVVQFFAWMGWFPFLFYITTYMGDLCKFPVANRNPLERPLIRPRSSRSSIPHRDHYILSVPVLASAVLRPLRHSFHDPLRHNSSPNKPPSPILHFFPATTNSDVKDLSGCAAS